MYDALPGPSGVPVLGRLKAPPLKLAIAVMAYGGQISSHHAQMWLDLGAALERHAEGFVLWQFSTWDVNPVDRARNLALAHAMIADADWLLMVDADTFVMPRMGFSLLSMIAAAADGGYTIVVAPVMSRGDNRKDNDDLRHVMAYGHNGLGPERGLYPIDEASTAIMAINLHKVGGATFKFIEPTETQQGMSEDRAFCRQIRAAGGKIACDTRVSTGHLMRPGVAYSIEAL